MEDKRSVIISAIIGILVLALIIGVIVYLIRFITNRPSNLTSTSRASAVVRSSTVPGATSAPAGNGHLPSTDNSSNDDSSDNSPANSTNTTKKYQGQGFELVYPSDWGLLTCSNSENIELNPTDTTDQKDVACGYALKPITILVGENGCQSGENVNKGGVIFTREKVQTETGVNYKWCTQTTPPLEITHRVSSSGSRATSQQDFSAQIEDMISQIRFGNSI